MHFPEEAVGQIIVCKAGDWLSPLGFQLCQRYQLAVRILDISQHPDFVSWVGWHSNFLDSLQVLIADRVYITPLLH